MSSTVLCALILLACALKFSAAQSSCKGRCGAEYYRGYMCQCDYNCLTYGECCTDYESQCTTKNSCKGRCGESFKRGRLCSCDSHCAQYKQCCPDYDNHCDAEEQISGEASATATKKTSSCNNVNDNKVKDQTLSDTTDQHSTYSEGNDADDSSVPPVSPTSHPPDDLTDDMHDQIFTSDEFSQTGLDDLEASPVPEISGGYEVSTIDLLGQVSTEPTVTTAVILSDDVTTVEAPNESIDASGMPFTLLTTAADHSYSQPSSTLVPLAESTVSTSSPALETHAPEDVDVTDAILPSDELDVSTVPSDNQDFVTDLDNLLVTATPSLPTPDSTTIPEEPTLNPLEDVTSGPPSVLPDTEEPSTSASTTGSEELSELEPVTPHEEPSTGASTTGSEELSELEPVTAHVPSVTAAAQDDTTQSVTTADLLTDTSKPTSAHKAEPTTAPLEKPDPYKLDPAKPTSKPYTKPLETLTVDDTRDYQADDSNDTNLCSGRPVSGVTTLRNGTMVVFRGHYFWLLDRNRVPGPPQGITQVWGVPSPIDTVFTRCNCLGKTYIFKGSQYWRFENDVLDPGYPSVITTGFDGLRGHITAALSVPQYKKRSESVYFFKRGGLVQKYSYQAGTSPTCGRKVQYAIYTRNRVARQAAPVLEPAISIRTSWRGFPTTITAAVSVPVSVPSNREPEGYKYYVFSRSKAYSVRMDGERPAIAAPAANTSPQTNNFFKCPKKIQVKK